MSKHKIEIFDVLGAINKKNIVYYHNLDEEQQKAIAPPVVMRWLTGTYSARQVYFVNELVNPFVFSLWQHKSLLYYLMTLCTTGNDQRYKWFKSVSKKNTKMPTAVNVLRQYYRYSTEQAIEALALLSDEDILEYAEELGFQPEDIKTIKKELKTRTSS